jgi:hypothetical protein
MGKDEAQMAYNEALKVKNETEYARTALQDLFVRISGFLSADGATPDDIKQVNPQHQTFSVCMGIGSQYYGHKTSKKIHVT